ncbi:MAG: DUF4097 family beta strand repeat-containing protein [Candidatus Aminicenantes bacterium]
MVTFGDFPGYSAPWYSVRDYESLDLKMGGTLSLENIDGNIDVLGWDKSKVKLYAEKSIPFSAGRRVIWQPMGRFLPKIDIDQIEDFVKIKTQPAERDDDNSAVDYFLKVPRHIYLRDIVARRGDVIISDLYGEAFIELEQGEINVDNFSGTLHVSLGAGSVEASLMDLRKEDEIRISAEEGDIIVYLQKDVRAQMEASTLEGKVTNEFNPDEEPSSNKISFHTSEEGAIISLSTSKGNILIKKIQEDNGKIF